MMSQHKLKMCRAANAGYGGKCITQKDVDDLWHLYIEVYTQAIVTHYSYIVYYLL